MTCVGLRWFMKGHSKKIERVADILHTDDDLIGNLAYNHEREELNTQESEGAFMLIREKGIVVERCEAQDKADREDLGRSQSIKFSINENIIGSVETTFPVK